MSETIEERAKRICKRLDYIDAWNAGGEEAIELIEDLMAERGKKVNLDEIFPKEVMEKSTHFRVGDSPFVYRHNDLPVVLPSFADCSQVVISARRMKKRIPGDIELARVRVRLGLTVEIVEDMMAADVGMQTMAATKREREKRLWGTINEKYPETRDYACRYKPDTGEIVFLYKAPKHRHADD